jgi:hypothetical protein
VVNDIVREELVVRQRSLVGHGSGVDLAIFARVLQLHYEINEILYNSETRQKKNYDQQ